MNIIGKSKNVTRSRGFTLIELMVSIAILGIMAGFSSWAYLNVQKNSDLANQTSQLVNTIRQVQSYAMTGQTGITFQKLSISKAYAAGAGVPPPTNEQLDMGIHLETDRYILFYGSTYNPEDPKNLATVFPTNISISIDLPTSDLVFTALTGEVLGYDANHNTVTINHSDGQSHTLTVNKLGVVDVD